MSIERSYRRLLLAYPPDWRAARGEEVVAVLLDGAQARQAQRPSLAEAVDLVGHGLLARAGLPTARLGARAAELTATMALASLTSLSALCLFFGEWWPWQRPVAGGGDLPLSTIPGTPGPFWTAGGVLFTALLLPAVLAGAGRPRAARLVLGIALPLTAVLPLAARLLHVNRPGAWALLGALAFTCLSLLAPVRRRTLLVALTSGLCLALGYAAWSSLDPSFDPRTDFYYGPVLQRLALQVPVGVLVAVAVSTGWRALTPTCLVSAVWLGMFAVRLHSATGDNSGAGLYLLAALTVLAAAYLARAARRWVRAARQRRTDWLAG